MGPIRTHASTHAYTHIHTHVQTGMNVHAQDWPHRDQIISFHRISKTGGGGGGGGGGGHGGGSRIP